MTDAKTDVVEAAQTELEVAISACDRSANSQFGASGASLTRVYAAARECARLSALSTPKVQTEGLAGELRQLADNASEGPWAYRPDKYDDWGFVRGPEREADWVDYPIRPLVLQARHSDLQDDELLSECRKNKTDPWGADAKLIVWLRNHIPEILSALQSEPDELLGEAARTLVDKLDECEPHISSAFFMAFERMGSKYDGPQYGEQLTALKGALARLEGAGE